MKILVLTEEILKQAKVQSVTGESKPSNFYILCTEMRKPYYLVFEQAPPQTSIYSCKVLQHKYIPNVKFLYDPEKQKTFLIHLAKPGASYWFVITNNNRRAKLIPIKIAVYDERYNEWVSLRVMYTDYTMHKSWLVTLNPPFKFTMYVGTEQSIRKEEYKVELEKIEYIGQETIARGSYDELYEIWHNTIVKKPKKERRPLPMEYKMHWSGHYHY